MSGIRLYRSNSLERLADRFCRDVSSAPLPPLEQELVLVQSIGMGRWLSLSAAEHLGVWANVRYLYPNAFLDLVFSSVLAGYDAKRQMSKHLAAWRIMEELPRLTALPQYEPLAGYLGDGSVIKLFQLSEKIADMYDQYIASRPDMVLCWDRGEDVSVTQAGKGALANEDLWQSDLWRRVRSALPVEHRGNLRERFLPALSGLSSVPGIRRISVFGASTLPPFHVGILQSLSDVLPVSFYLLSPTRHYWGDIAGQRAQIRIERKRGRRIDEDEHYAKGNSLLASLGDLGREFSDILSFASDFDMTEDDDFISERGDTLLHRLQDDICELRDREERGIVSTSDRSIQIHSCHSVMREVEVLRDNLLEMFANDASLQPRDVLVMTPDIDLYAPYIEAVFGAAESDNLKIPYSIADRNVRARSTLIAPFLSMLSLNEKRFAASAVIDFLSSVPVCQKWNFSDDDVSLLRGWIAGTAIRWGVDGRDREIHSGAAFSQNSFVEGMRRLVSGYAMKEEGVLSGGILPAEFAEGSSGKLLGYLAEIVDTLASFARFMRESHSPAEWSQRLEALLGDLFEPGDEGEEENLQIRDVLKLLRSSSNEAGFTGLVDYRVVRDYLVSRLDETKTQFGFLNGRATFCAILPMRSIPFKVICIIGLNDGAFPRVSKPLSFDLIARFPSQGDRSQRKDDRYLFLETILSARSCLYLSHIGRSIRDNSPIPPSVLVSELLDHIASGYVLDGTSSDDDDAQKRLRDHLVTAHRLHAFSRDYFSGRNPKLFSYSPSAAAVALSSGTSFETENPCMKPLGGDVPSDLLTVDPAALVSFFSNPARFFLRQRLGVIFRSGEEAVEDTEPFDIDHFTGIGLQEEIVGCAFADEPADRVRTRALHSGVLPPCAYGEHLYDALEAEALRLARRASAFKGSVQIPVRVSFEHGGVALDGMLHDVTEKGLVSMRSFLWGRDNFRIWLQHLMLCAAAPEGAECASVFVTLDGGLHLPPMAKETAEERLRVVLELYRQGLSAPLKFFPKSSYAYAAAHFETEDEDKKGERGFSAASDKWSPARANTGKGECEDECFSFCFAREPLPEEGYPLDGEFAANALHFFEGFFELKEDADAKL